jgi:ubiquinone/menaquinone biosynthesis C-methylase UbiE
MTEQKPQTGMGAERWANDMGERWHTHLDQFEGMLMPIGAALIDAAGFKVGERVIDIGCGGGVTSFDISRRVGPSGFVTGLDISPVLVEAATQRAREAGLKNVRFVAGDAGKTAAVGHDHDFLFSRFGVMFFEDPYSAFTHMRGFLRPGARMLIGCWGPPQENPWMGQMMNLATRYADLPPPDPRAPGPMAFSEPDYVRDVLNTAGFSSINIAPWRGEQYVGGPGANAKQAAEFAVTALSLGDVLANKPQAVKDEVRAGVEDFFAPHAGPRGVVMPAMVWFISATA